VQLPDDSRPLLQDDSIDCKALYLIHDGGASTAVQLLMRLWNGIFTAEYAEGAENEEFSLGYAGVVPST
jgi:hypothetical protein